MTAGIERARQMADEAPHAYAKLRAEVLPRVVRWRWASFTRHSYRPAHFEISATRPGDWLPDEPEVEQSGVHAYGFDADGRVCAVRQTTGLAGRVYETFYRHRPDGIESWLYGYDPSKSWINVEWLPIDGRGVVASHTVYARGNHISLTYHRDPNGRVERCGRRGTNPPYGDLDDGYDLEYDGTGRVVKVVWQGSDGRRTVEFERPAREATLAARRRDLVRELAAATRATIEAVDLDEPIYAVVFAHCGADYQRRLPPDLYLGTVSERDGFEEAYEDDAPDYLWNPAEWSADPIELRLSPALKTLCASVSQDVWQNELYLQVDMLLEEIGKALGVDPPSVPLTDDVVFVSIALDRGDYAEQVTEQVDDATAEALEDAGRI